MQVLADRVLILPIAAERQTASGIIFADTVTSTESDTATGLIVTVGGGRTTDAGLVIPAQVTVGQRVLYNRHAGHELDVAGIAHVMVRESDILAVLV